jgi:hypothetical protein
LISVPELAAEGLSDYLTKHMGRRFGSTDAKLTELLPLVARLSSDAALFPFHVDRSKLYAMDRLGKEKVLDAARIADAIEYTRFPSPGGPEQDDSEEGSLVRAADLIGQLGDPHYLRKANALYYEFQEVGMNRQLGYTSPTDLTDQYPQFYWNNVSPHIQTAIRYLNVTSSGRQWLASLSSNVFSRGARTQSMWTAALRSDSVLDPTAGIANVSDS